MISWLATTAALALAHPAAPSPGTEDAVTRALLTGNADAVLNVLGADRGVPARAVRAAVWDLTGDARATSERAQIPAPDPAPALTPQRAISPKPGALAFVASSAARLRRAAHANAEIEALLPIGTPLEIVSVKDGFARVRVGRRTVRWRQSDAVAELVAPAKFPAATVRDDGTPVTGFVALALLDGASTPLAALIRDGDAAIAHGDVARATALLSRAAALDPHDLGLRERLIRAALRSGDAALAVQTGLVLGDVAERVDDGPDDQNWPHASIALAQACRGDVARATMVGPDAPHAPADACLVDLDLRDPCPPRDTRQDTGNATVADMEDFAAHLATEIAEHDRELRKRNAALDRKLAAYPMRAVAVVDLSLTGRALPPLWWTRAELDPQSAGCGADLASMAKPRTLRLKLPRTTDSERALRIVIDLGALEGSAFVLEGSPPGVGEPRSALASQPGATFIGDAFTEGDVLMWGPRKDGDPARPEKSEGVLPVIRIAAPSFCAVNTCVP